MKDLEHTFPASREPFWHIVKKSISDWLTDQGPLFEALTVAFSLHILALPLFWFIGWALPWPKSPEVMTIMEINLENWPNQATPEKIIDIYKSNMHK